MEIDASALPKAKICTDCCEGYAPLRVRFDASECSGSIRGYQWAIDDVSGVRPDLKFQHTFVDPGTYIVILTVTDDQNRTAKDLIKIKVVDPSKKPKSRLWLP